MGIVRFALRFPHTFYVVAALILFLGIAAIRSMPTDIFPEINIPVVTVIWQYTGLTTPEMEQRVTTYSQYAISTSVNGIKNMEAQTINGVSVQKLYFQPDVKIDLAVAQIVSATNAIRALMPPGIQPPIIVQFNASSVPVAVPHESWGETVAAEIVTNPSEALTLEDVSRYLDGRLAKYKIPRLVYFSERLPHTPTDKVQKFLLRESRSKNAI
jgi:multidrug efflux pump subunit AcrB